MKADTLTNLGIPEVHHRKPVKLSANRNGAKVEHHSVEKTVGRCIIPWL